MFFCGVGRRPHANVKRFGPFKVIKTLTESGFGPIFLGKHGLTGEKRLIRTLSPRLEKNTELKRLFKRDHQLRLHHPHIVKKFAFKKQDDTCYITEEYIPGMSLEMLLKERQKLTISESLHIISQLCSALSFAHKKGALHGRLSPSKVLLEGKTKSYFSNARKSPHSKVHWVNKSVDLPSLGQFLYSLLTGHDNRSSEDSSTGLGVPLWLLNILLKMKDHNPHKRYKNIDEVLSDLQLYAKQSHKYRQHPFIGETVGDSLILEKIGEHRRGDLFLGQKKQKCLREDESKKSEFVILATIRPEYSKPSGDMSSYKRTTFPKSFLRPFHWLSEHYQFSENNGAIYMELDFSETTHIDRRLQRLGIYDEIEAIRIVRRACLGAKSIEDFDQLKEHIHPEHFALRTVLTDFQPLMTEEESDRLLMHGIVGNPSYLSPEQCRGTKIDCRSDIYSLGTLFYEMLTGQRLFRGDTTIELFYKQIEDQPELPHELNPEIPGALSSLIMKMLAKKPEHRYQSCDEVLIDLERIRERNSGHRLEELTEIFRGQYFFSKEVSVESRSAQYHGVHESTKKAVTVTVLDGDAFSKDYCELERRARVLSSLPKAHFLQIRKLNLTHAFPHMIEERDSGETLGQKVQARKALERPEVVDLGLWLFIALRAIHNKGYTHGALNAESIFLTTNVQLKLLNSAFLEIGSKVQLSQRGLQFIAPEQLKTQKTTIASDLYAAGVCLYYAATGQWPFDKRRSRQDIYALKNQALPKPPVFIDYTITLRFSDFIMKLLAQRPEQRYQSTEEALIDLKWIASKRLGPPPHSRRSWLSWFLPFRRPIFVKL